MKRVTMFAMIGSVLGLVSTLWWIINQFVGWENLRGIANVMVWLCLLAQFVMFSSYVVFFYYLLKRQRE